MDSDVAGTTANDGGGDDDAAAAAAVGSVPLDVLSGAALLIDANGFVVASNEDARRLFGCDPTGDAIAALLNQTELPMPRDEPVRLRAQGRHGDHVPFIADISVADSDLADGHRLVVLRELDSGLLLEESRRLLDLAFDGAPIGMAFFNPEGEYIRVNWALCRLLDRPAEALLGRRDQEFTHPDGPAAPARRRGPAHEPAQPAQLRGRGALTLELSARHGISGCLLMIDLDGFKEINDTYGHAAGDAALAAVARGLRDRLRSTDLLARIGGDEFAVLLRATDGPRAQKVAEALVRRVRETRLAPGGPDIALDASVGIADFGSFPLPTVEELFASADAAMYAEKRKPREDQA